MIANLTLFSTIADLEHLTGLSYEGLWEAGFDLDDFDFGLSSDVPLHTYERADDWPDSDPGIIAGTGDMAADWIVSSMTHHRGEPLITEYDGRYWYLLHH